MNTLKLVLCLLALCLALVWLGNNNGTTHASSSPGQARTATAPAMTIDNKQQHSIQGKPSLSAQQIDAILCNANSPVCGTGQTLYDLGKQYGIDPAYALAFFKHESSFGLYGVATTNLGIGNIRCTPGYQCLHGFRAYQSWQQGYADWYQLIRWYITTLHKSTVEQIVPTYAPSVENDVDAYISSVEQSVSSWRTGRSA